MRLFLGTRRLQEAVFGNQDGCKTLNTDNQFAHARSRNLIKHLAKMEALPCDDEAWLHMLRMATGHLLKNYTSWGVGSVRLAPEILEILETQVSQALLEVLEQIHAEISRKCQRMMETPWAGLSRSCPGDSISQERRESRRQEIVFAHVVKNIHGLCLANCFLRNISERVVCITYWLACMLT